MGYRGGAQEENHIYKSDYTSECGLVRAIATAEPKPIRTVKQARQTPEWDIPGGWREGCQKDVGRCLKEYKTLSYVPASEYAKAVAAYGERAEVLYVVCVFKSKRLGNGEFDRRTLRITVSDVNDGMPVAVETASSNVGGQSVRMLAQISVNLNAEVEYSDVPGAYYRGTPVAPKKGGRAVFLQPPGDLAEFGYPRTSPTGQRMLIRVDGNMPGLRKAGAIWAREYNAFLIGKCGFSQSIVNRRIFFKFDGKRAVCSSWVCMWMTREYEAAAPEDGRTFCGVTYERVADGSLRVSCLNVISDLELKLEMHPQPPGASHDSPMAADGLTRLRLPQSESNPLMPPATKAAARSIAGSAGWVATAVRPDVQFSFVAVSQSLGNHFTLEAWRAVLRLGHYLVATKDLKLTYRKAAAGERCAAWCDSSSCNRGAGESYGGFSFGWPRSGLIAWRVLVPKRLTDSSWGSELISATLVLKAVLALRIQLRELSMTFDRPTVVHMDAAAVLLGRQAEHLSRNNRYMAARYAMIREAESALALKYVEILGSLNVADLFSKPLVGAAFRLMRAMALGLRG